MQYLQNQQNDYIDVTLEDAMDEMLRREEEERGRYFVPNGKSEEFINAFGNTDLEEFIFAFIAGNGTSKSTTLINVAFALCYKDLMGSWFKAPLFINYPYEDKYIRIISDPTTIKMGLIPELKKWFPIGRYTSDKMGKNYEYMFYTDTGWKIEFMTYEQDLKEFESVTVPIILLDEPPPYSIYLACLSRLRRGGRLGLFFTPLMEAAWAYDEFATKSPEQLKEEYKYLINATIEDNCKIHGVRGILDHDMIVKMFKNMPADEVKARAEGKFQALQGLIVKEYNPRIHVIKPFDTNPQDYCYVELLDPHPQMPDALIYIAIDRYGRAFIAEEVYRNMDLDELVITIKKCRQGKRIIASLVDPIAFNEDQHLKYANTRQKYTLAKYLEDKGIKFEKASKARHEGIKLMKQAFKYVEQAGLILKYPSIYIFENCTRTMFEISHWQWEEWRGAKKYVKNPRGKPVDKDDHMMENIGRFFLGNFQFKIMPENYFQDKGWNPLMRSEPAIIAGNSLQIYD